MNFEFSVAIPARFGASRLPGKPLRQLNGRPMVAHVVDRALAAGAAEVVVATDDERIAVAVQGRGARVCLTRADHPSGTDRLAEVAQQLGWPDARIVVNLQGDEPLAPVSGIRTVAETLAASGAPMATLATPVLEVEELFSPNCVKLVRAAPSPATATICPLPPLSCATSASTATVPASCAATWPCRRACWNGPSPWSSCACSRQASASRWHWRPSRSRPASTPRPTWPGSKPCSVR